MEPDIRRKRHLGRLAEGRRKWAESVLRQLAGLLGDERSGWTGHLKLVVLPPVDVASDRDGARVEDLTGRR